MPKLVFLALQSLLNYLTMKEYLTYIITKPSLYHFKMHISYAHLVMFLGV